MLHRAAEKSYPTSCEDGRLGLLHSENAGVPRSMEILKHAEAISVLGGSDAASRRLPSIDIRQ